MRSNKIVAILVLSLGATALAGEVHKPEMSYLIKKPFVKMRKLDKGFFDSTLSLSLLGELMEYPKEGAQELGEREVNGKTVKCQVSAREQDNFDKLGENYAVDNWGRFVKSRRTIIPLMAKDNNPVRMQIAMVDRRHRTFSTVSCAYLNPDGESHLSEDDVADYLLADVFTSTERLKSKRFFYEYSERPWWKDPARSKVPLSDNKSMAQEIFDEIVNGSKGNNSDADILDSTASDDSSRTESRQQNNQQGQGEGSAR